MKRRRKSNLQKYRCFISHSLSAKFNASATSAFGALTVKASDFALQGDLYSNTSIYVEPSMTISSNTVISSLNGYGGIAFLGSVQANTENVSLQVQAAQGPVDVEYLGSQDLPLGEISLLGTGITLRGDMYSKDSITLSGGTTINQSLTLKGDLGITLDGDLVPSTEPFDLSLTATSGAITTKKLGTESSDTEKAQPLGNISVINTGGPVTCVNLIASKDITLQGTSIAIGSQFLASGNVNITNTDALFLPLLDLTLSGNFTQTGTGSFSLGGNIQSSGLIQSQGPMLVNADTTFQGNKGIFITGAMTAGSESLTLTLDTTSSSSVTFSENSGPAFGNVSVTAGTSVTFAGNLSSNSSITITAPILTLVGTSSYAMTANDGIVITSSIGGDASQDLSLNVFAGPISLGGDVHDVNAFTIVNATEASIYNIVTKGDISVSCPTVIQSSGGTISSNGGNISFASRINPSASGKDLVINSGSGTISMQEIGNTLFFEDVTIIGGVVSLAKDVSLTRDFRIENTNTLSLLEMNLKVGRNFNQAGIGSVSLGTSIQIPGSMAFTGSIDIYSDVILQASKGISLTGSISPISLNPKFTLNAASYPLVVKFAESPGNSFGTLGITALNLTLEGNVTSNDSIHIGCPIAISADTNMQGPLGITLDGAVTAKNTALDLTLNAGSSSLTVSGLGTKDVPLGALSLTGSSLNTGGDIVATKAIAFAGPVIIGSSVTFKGSEINLENNLSASQGGLDLTLQTTEGPINAQNLGTNDVKLQDISIISGADIVTENLLSSRNITLQGASITLGSQFVASGAVQISNTGDLTIPSGTLSLSGNFTQTGSGRVFLSGNIQTDESISFQGPLTVTANTTLRGSQGVSIPASINPGSGNPTLSLDAGSNSLSVTFNTTADKPFGALTIKASDFALKGDLYSTTSIYIEPNMTISSNTVISSLNGYGGIAFLGSVQANTGNVSLQVQAAQGPVDVEYLGSQEVPLGNISLIGTGMTLRGSMYSTDSITLSGKTTINTDILLRGDLGITLDGDLVPSTEPFDLFLTATNGAITTKKLGTGSSDTEKAQPLGNVSLSGNKITTGTFVIAESYSVTSEEQSIYGPCNASSYCEYPAYTYPSTMP